jgi:hypothetical protein
VLDGWQDWPAYHRVTRGGEAGSWIIDDQPLDEGAAPMRSISRAMISDRLVLMKYRASVSRAPAGVS